MNINEAFSSDESKEIYDKFLAIVNSRRDNLVKKYGKEAERIAYASAVNQVKKKAGNSIEEPTTEEPMDPEQKLKEMIQSALSKPLNEFETGEELIADEPISEDLDLGHQDNEPHMIKAELAHIAKYAIELYKMVDQFEGPQEVDFPAWWQSKITTARNMISSAKHYLEFELDEPKIDAMAGIASEEDVIDEEMTPEKSKKIGMSFKDKIKEVVLAKLKQK
jgi:chorismate mutase